MLEYFNRKKNILHPTFLTGNNTVHFNTSNAFSLNNSLDIIYPLKWLEY